MDAQPFLAIRRLVPDIARRGTKLSVPIVVQSLNATQGNHVAAA